MARDRVYINANYREFIDDLKKKDLLGFEMVENKDSFLIAVALGLQSPSQLKSKDGWFLLKNLKSADKALLSSVLLGTANSDEEIDAYADLDKNLGQCEQCAEAGFAILQKKINDANGDEDILEARLLKELDLLYTKVVENDI